MFQLRPMGQSPLPLQLIPGNGHYLWRKNKLCFKPTVR
jgi:hypothetical protein